jgi:hypothetical protein
MGRTSPGTSSVKLDILVPGTSIQKVLMIEDLRTGRYFVRRYLPVCVYLYCPENHHIININRINTARHVPFQPCFDMVEKETIVNIPYHIW